MLSMQWDKMEQPKKKNKEGWKFREVYSQKMINILVFWPP